MDNYGNTPKGARLAFGILMVIVYIGVGLLFIFDIFSIDNAAVTYVVGGLLCLYGVWRGYRLYKGMN
ncbi:MAG: hypothetical protein K2N88_05450 [Muribaculaceae bacterium]|nr:hypothetical protein [Muribaculaceae bacterium]